MTNLRNEKPSKARRASIQNLRSHPEPYVTVGELAEYWLVSRKQIYKQIDGGTLRAIKLGPRLLRIRTLDAIEFERAANMHAAPHQKHGPRPEEQSGSAQRAHRRR